MVKEPSLRTRTITTVLHMVCLALSAFLYGLEQSGITLACLVFVAMVVVFYQC